MKNKNKLTVKNFAQIREGSVEFGDLTFLVGPQASGKSLFLQLLKLIIDKDDIASDLREKGYYWDEKENGFMQLFFGEGMSGIWKNNSTVEFFDKLYSLESFGIQPKIDSLHQPNLFYIPAQRVISMQQGWPRNFNSFDSGDPYVLKTFSETLRLMTDINPLKPGMEHYPFLDSSIFYGAHLEMDVSTLKKRFVLNIDNIKLPFMTWSAGQKEFMPLLLSFRYINYRRKGFEKDNVEWIVIEEPEMGLHPHAIQTLMVIFLDLVSRGYKVIISTHSPVLLELAWAMNYIKQFNGTADDLQDLFPLKKGSNLKEVFKTTIDKSYKTYYFNRQKDGVRIKDISELDAGSDDISMANWGGLSEFASKASEIVSRLVANANEK